MPNPLARVPNSAKLIHALHTSISRRTARPPSGLGSRGQAREVEEGRAGVEGAVAVPAGEDALVHGQRPEGILSRLLLRQARRHHRLPDGDGGRRFHRGRRAARCDGRAAATGSDPRRRAARGAPQDALRRDGARREILRRHTGLAQWRQGARLSRRPRHLACDATAISARLCAARSLCAEGASRRPRHSGRRHGGSRAAGFRRRYPGALRSLPRSRDVSDHRSARPGDRLRRPRAGEGCSGEIPELPGNAAVPQGRQSLQPLDRARCRAQRLGPDRGRRLCRRHRHGDVGLCRQPWRRSAPR